MAAFPVRPHRDVCLVDVLYHMLSTVMNTLCLGIHRISIFIEKYGCSDNWEIPNINLQSSSQSQLRIHRHCIVFQGWDKNKEEKKEFEGEGGRCVV